MKKTILLILFIAFGLNIFAQQQKQQKISPIIINKAADKVAKRVFKDILKPKKITIHESFEFKINDNKNIDIIIICDDGEDEKTKKELESSISASLSKNLKEDSHFAIRTSEDVSTADANMYLHFKYSKDTNLDKLVIHSVQLENMQKNEKWSIKEDVVVSLKPMETLGNSAVMPGWGQLRLEETAKAKTYFFSFVGAAAITGGTYFFYDFYKKEAQTYLNPPQNMGLYDHNMEIAQNIKYGFYASATLTGVIYLLNLTNVYGIIRDIGDNNNLSFYPQFNQNYSGLTLQLKF